MSALSPEYILSCAVSFELPESPRGLPIMIERARPAVGPDRWAVRCTCDCLGKDGEWRYEPLPSSRDDAFLAMTRFSSLEEAFAAARAVARKMATVEDPPV